ncbi:MAG TPA: hypothetical protein DG048_05395 [Pseudoalteromonas sp.]|nr:hypothetical protein [Pseudoalteromonas sp.]
MIRDVRLKDRTFDIYLVYIFINFAIAYQPEDFYTGKFDKYFKLIRCKSDKKIMIFVQFLG